MVARTPPEAIAQFASALRQTLACVTRVVPNVRGGYWPSAQPHELLLGPGAPVALRGTSRLRLTVRLRYRIVERPSRAGWVVEVAAYEYRLSDRDDREIMAYHWHPEGSSHVRTPHLHLGPGADVGLRALTTAHLPTGPIHLADVIDLAIESLGALPLRNDWRQVLDAARRAAGVP